MKKKLLYTILLLGIFTSCSHSYPENEDIKPPIQPPVPKVKQYVYDANDFKIGELFYIYEKERYIEFKRNTERTRYRF